MLADFTDDFQMVDSADPCEFTWESDTQHHHLACRTQDSLDVPFVMVQPISYSIDTPVQSDSDDEEAKKDQPHPESSLPSCTCKGLCASSHGSVRGSVGCLAEPKSWCRVLPVLLDGVLVATRPLPPLCTHVRARGLAPLVILVHKAVADVGPLVQLARALQMRGRQVAVVLQKSCFAQDFEATSCGLIVFCNLLAEEEALNRIQPSAVLYTMPAHVQMKRYEQHAAVPTVLVGFEKAEIDLDYPPRPSLKAGL
ncbi:unnamed protein product [Polarella glacialis]|uniref:Uncharacterized protein n=1 Tax=Polarella glacialis TaxID=89957 RepID=A0A813GUD9_POLGL|nr:unnamed protein product [Polarella glacialis]